MEFFCVYCKTRKKVDKFIKVNRIKNKYIIDIKKIMEEEEVNFDDDKMYLKVIIFNKIQQAIDKKKDIYYIPDFDNEFSIEKLLNLKTKNDFILLEEGSKVSLSNKMDIDDESPATSFSYLIDKLLGGE